MVTRRQRARQRRVPCGKPGVGHCALQLAELHILKTLLVLVMPLGTTSRSGSWFGTTGFPMAAGWLQ